MHNLNKRECLVCQLGLVTFPEAMEFEHRLIQLHYEEKIGDVLLIFEHPPTITLGRFGNMKNILLAPEELAQRGIEFYNSDRGGDATFNCPGQPVIHPIIDLHFRGARSYIAELEEMSLRVLHDYNIAGERSQQHQGIWVKGKQIGALGLRMRHGISMHGISLNVNPDLSSFEAINLCGIPGVLATSIEHELGKSVSMEEVDQRILDSFANVFDVNLLPISKEQLTTVCFEPQPA